MEKSCLYSEAHAYRATCGMKTETFARKITELARFQGGLAEKELLDLKPGWLWGEPTVFLCEHLYSPVRDKSVHTEQARNQDGHIGIGW